MHYEGNEGTDKEMEKIAFVCQRYGPEVNGGSEQYCLQTAEKLAGKYDVTVYTTCALDYVTWRNHYAEGEEKIRGVRVKRYRVEKERNQEKFNRLSAKVLTDPNHTDEEEKEWIEEQGPYCPALLEALKREHREYRVVFFMTYLYYLSATGLLMKLPNAALIPTAHDEAPIYLRHYEKVFAGAKGLAWLTPEERAFTRERFPFIKDTPEIMIGAGIDMPRGELPMAPKKIRKKRYLVYAGRIDESKGCGELFDFYRKYKREHGRDLKLVLMGRAVMRVPMDPDIISLGFVSEDVKYAVMRDAFALVLSSRFESLSIVVLESMMMGRPVLVTGQCAVLKGHVVRSGAGLYYNNYSEFAGCIKWLEEHPEEYQAMRANGRKYVKEKYSWYAITNRFAELINQVSRDERGE